MPNTFLTQAPTMSLAAGEPPESHASQTRDCKLPQRSGQAATSIPSLLHRPNFVTDVTGSALSGGQVLQPLLPHWIKVVVLVEQKRPGADHDHPLPVANAELIGHTRAVADESILVVRGHAIQELMVGEGEMVDQRVRVGVIQQAPALRVVKPQWRLERVMFR